MLNRRLCGLVISYDAEDANKYEITYADKMQYMHNTHTKKKIRIQICKQ